VLIIEGGPVGVELAGEIATDFPEKKVTLVHSGDRLIEYLGKKACVHWEARGVVVVEELRSERALGRRRSYGEKVELASRVRGVGGVVGGAERRAHGGE
jgi:hypothetical protein